MHTDWHHLHSCYPESHGWLHNRARSKTSKAQRRSTVRNPLQRRATFIMVLLTAVFANAVLTWNVWILKKLLFLTYQGLISVYAIGKKIMTFLLVLKISLQGYVIGLNGLTHTQRQIQSLVNRDNQTMTQLKAN